VANTIKVNAGDRVEVQLTDWRFLVRETRKIEPQTIASFQRNATKIARPVESKIRQGITNKFAIRGMQPKVVPGRLTWGGVVPPKTTMIKVDTRLRKKGKSIASVWVMSPAVAIFDYAEKYGKYDGKKTKQYKYSRSSTGYRDHTRNGQGRHMVDAIDRSPARRAVKPSRIVWPSGLAAIPQANAEMLTLVNNVAGRINAEIIRNA
jgi:hypothetical protein